MLKNIFIARIVFSYQLKLIKYIIITIKLTSRHSMIGSLESAKIVKIKRKVPKLKEVTVGKNFQAKNSKNCQFWPKRGQLWTKMANFWPSQNLPGIQSIIFSKKNIKTTLIPKIRKFYRSVWKLQAKLFQNSQLWSKMAKFWPQMAKF